MSRKTILVIYVIGLFLMFAVLFDICNEQKGAVLSIVPLMISGTWGTAYFL